MVISYLDTSAAMKLLVDELESDALVTYLQRTTESTDEVTLLASWLLHTELHCAANRHPNVVDLESVGVVLDTVTLVDLTRGDLLTSATLPGKLRSNDAVHLAVALRLGCEELITYDTELASAAVAAGLAIAAPA